MAAPVLVAILFLFLLCLSQAKDTLEPGESLRETETFVSSNGVFELGFFSPSSALTSNHYLGIWFRNDPHKKPVWVANREYPIFDSPGVLSIRYDGNLVITDRRQIPIILNAGALATSNNTSATLLDSGNLVLQERGEIVWQSFNYPSDTFLPGMRVGLFNLGTDHWRKQFLVSWQSPSVPSTGSFVFCLQTENKTWLKVWHGHDFAREIGFWDGHKFKLFFHSLLNDYNFNYISNDNETYLTFSTRGNDSHGWLVMSSSGEIEEYKIKGENVSMVSHSICENSTDSNATACYLMNPSMCQNGDKFSEINGSMPNLIIVNESVRLGTSDCEIICRSNCSCTAFASFRDDGTGCEFYYGDKSVLLETIGEGNGTLFIRGDTPMKSGKTPMKSGKTPIISDYQKQRRRLWLIIVIPIVSLGVLVILSLMCYSGWISHSFTGGWKGCRGSTRGSRELFLLQLGGKKDHELLKVNFDCVAKATNNFSAANKLGEGGFGPVYKGVLLGHEIAVKRLSRRSGQGLEEFKNEVQLICKLQHRNLVRLLGCCIEREEKILVYEYMANNSLDSFIYDPTKRKLLDWKNRFCIIEGIAQGLLYLHKHSRLRIIHRDLKTSNILLDSHMNPKISDFGMARIFGEDEAQTKTIRVVGTYGYMSPEYAVHGLFSTKSDVFSFGVIMLEIISGRKNITFCHLDRSLNLLGYAWELWKDGEGMKFMDLTLANSCSKAEVMLCIQVALLCVQERPENRPNMSDVISMLTNESTFLPVPKQPAFCTDISYANSPRHQAYSQNDVTISVMEAR